MATQTSLQQETTYLRNGWSFDVTGVKTPYGKGVVIPPICNYIVTPIANDDTYVATGQRTTANKALTLNSTYTYTYNGSKVVVADCSRNLLIQFTNNVTADIGFTIVGYDINYRQVTEFCDITAGDRTTSTQKCFFMIQSITPNATVNNQNVTVGTQDIFGLPFYLAHKGDVNSVYWNNEVLASNFIATGYEWRRLGQTNSTSIEPNGRVLVDSVPDGVKTIRISYYCYGADSQFAAVLDNQVRQNTIGNASTDWAIDYAAVKKNTSNTAYAYGGITPYDLIAPQYPADSTFIAAYYAALTS